MKQKELNWKTTDEREEWPKEYRKKNKWSSEQRQRENVKRWSDCECLSYKGINSIFRKFLSIRARYLYQKWFVVVEKPNIYSVNYMPVYLLREDLFFLVVSLLIFIAFHLFCVKKIWTQLTMHLAHNSRHPFQRVWKNQCLLAVQCCLIEMKREMIVID